MESAAVRRAAPLPGLIQTGLVVALLALAAVGWAVTDERMVGMDDGPGTDPGTFGFYVSAWIVMMAAMMFPSIWPMVVMHARVQRGKVDRGQEVQAGATGMFVVGYLVTWTAAGLLFYGLLELGDALSLGLLEWDSGGPYVAGGVILAAAIYQLTPLKDVCLTKCRHPLMFMLNSWRPGRTGALRMGVEHGGWCVGCCWMLMAALFALGIMSVGWMVFVAALIATEKLLPWKALANRGIAVLLVALGLGVAFAPEDVPGLTLPGSMEMGMGMDGGRMGHGGSMADEKMGGSMADEKMGGSMGGSMSGEKMGGSMGERMGGDGMVGRRE